MMGPMHKYAAHHVSGRLLSLVMLACVTAAPANEQPSGLEEERRLFIAAEQALIEGDHERYRQLLPALEDYPLQPYLKYRDLRASMPLERRDEVLDFIQEHADSPLSWLIHRRWLERLAREEDWATYVADFRPTVSDPALRCQHLYGLLQLGHEAEAFVGAERLWLSGRSRPQACDPLFNAWQDSDGFTTDHVWERIKLAMDANQPGLARALRPLLAEQERALLDGWLEVDRYPHRINGILDRHATADPELRALIRLHAVRRQLRQDSDRAIAMWQRIKADDEHPRGAAHAQTHRHLALILAVRGHPGAGKLLDTVPEEAVDENIHAWRVRWNLARGDWEQTLYWLRQMPAGQAGEHRWQYWRARALDATGQHRRARSNYRDLAAHRNFHAFLAADHLERDYEFAQTPLVVSEQEIEALAATPAFRRIGELRHFNLELESRREWEAAASRLAPEQLAAAAHLAQRWGMHERAIRLLADAGYWDDLGLRFPIAYAELIDEESTRRQIDPTLPYAVIRRESSFDPDAISPVGARGLMQIMPGTGRNLASSFNEPLASPDLLFTPERNIRYGVRYLVGLLDRFDQHPALALGAYNAGSHKVRQWLPETAVDADIWIETLPYAETRGYIEAVLSYQLIYRRLLGLETIRLAERLPPVGSTLPSPASRAGNSE